MPSLFVLFNHTLTEKQRRDAKDSLGVDRILEPPSPIRKLWASIPAEAPALGPLLEPVRRWLDHESAFGDYVLIQGDFGATYLMVTHCLERGLIPVYATTQRRATEERLPDGSTRLTHVFEHQRFRRYGV